MTTKIIPLEVNHWTRVIKGECWSGSLEIYGPYAWRCISNNRIYDPCFSSSSYNNFVVCTGNPLTSSDRIKLKLTAPIIQQERENRFFGWRFELEDNSICDYFLYSTGTLSEKEMRLMKMGVTYSCNDGHLLLNSPNFDTSWTIEKFMLNNQQDQIIDSNILSIITVFR